MSCLKLHTDIPMQCRATTAPWAPTKIVACFYLLQINPRSTKIIFYHGGPSHVYCLVNMPVIVVGTTNNYIRCVSLVREAYCGVPTMLSTNVNKALDCTSYNREIKLLFHFNPRTTNSSRVIAVGSWVRFLVGSFFTHPLSVPACHQ